MPGLGAAAARESRSFHRGDLRERARARGASSWCSPGRRPRGASRAEIDQ